VSESPPVEPTSNPSPRARGTRYAYMRRDGTLDIVLGSLVAGVGAYAYQFLGGHSLGAEGFAAIGALLTAHFLAFVIILLPIEQFVIRRITLNRPGRIVPIRVYALVGIVTVVAASAVWFAAEAYFESDRRFVAFVVMTVVFHLAFAIGRGFLAGHRRFRSYGLVSGAASLFRLAIAIVVVVVAPSVTGFAWAQVLGPLVIFLWRPFRAPDKRPAGTRGRLDEEHLEAIDDRGLLTGLVLAAAASQALLLAGPLVVGALGASDVQFSITYATLLLARAPLTLGYNLIARVLPPFTEMAARGERPELRAWARGMGIAGAVLAVLGGILGALLGPLMVAIAFGSDFRPTAQVAGLAAAGVVLASAGLFVGQILVARSQPIRLAVSWLIALVASVGALLLPFDDPIVRVIVAFVVGEGVALVALVGGALMRDRQEGRISHGYTVAKRSVDIAGSLVLLVLLAPVLVIAAIAVRLDSEGPAFFRQIRIGRDGNEFWMVKLRTMAIDHDDEVYHEHLNRIREGVDDETEYSIRIDDDPRITGVGATLRRWSLDELPNLWNVLKGSMSLVGPRPLVPIEAEIIGLDSPRFTVKPGVTGLAQVRGRDSIPMDDRTRLDVEYVENRSTKLDVKILLETFTAVFQDPGDETSV
jgi:lipopolysaccharide/colanic/teichoic acid biosynthesis glycosyltransferase